MKAKNAKKQAVSGRTEDVTPLAAAMSGRGAGFLKSGEVVAGGQIVPESLFGQKSAEPDWHRQVSKWGH
jgi:hypothetical protein